VSAAIRGVEQIFAPLKSAHLNPKSPEEKPVNKADIVSVVADAADISKASASRAVEKVFESITTALGNGDVASIAGFGNFSVSERSARQGRNPRTGESIHIAASKSIKFKAGKALKDAVN